MNLYQSVRRQIRRLYPKTIILLYHRVAESSLDPQQLCVTPQHFDEQMTYLYKHFTVRRLSDLCRWDTDSGIVITFDDGYSDNLSNALPILEKHNLPATIFMSSRYIETGTPFWWNVIAVILLGTPTLPAQLELTLQGQVYCRTTVTQRERIQVYRELLEIGLHLDTPEIEHLVSNLRLWAPLSQWRDDWGRPLGLNEMLKLAQSPLIEVGAHTQNHLNLARQPEEVQCVEIQAGRQQLETWLDKSVTSFAYPFGFPGVHYNRQTVRAVQKSGFLRACANREGWVTWRSDPFQYPRFLVRNWNGDEFLQRLWAWLAI